MINSNYESRYILRRLRDYIRSENETGPFTFVRLYELHRQDGDKEITVSKSKFKQIFYTLFPLVFVRISKGKYELSNTSPIKKESTTMAKENPYKKIIDDTMENVISKHLENIIISQMPAMVKKEFDEKALPKIREILNDKLDEKIQDEISDVMLSFGNYLTNTFAKSPKDEDDN